MYYLFPYKYFKNDCCQMTALTIMILLLYLLFHINNILMILVLFRTKKLTKIKKDKQKDVLNLLLFLLLKCMLFDVLITTHAPQNRTRCYLNHRISFLLGYIKLKFYNLAFKLVFFLATSFK
ncbi:MAG: hypothetical protein ACI8WT_002111 [Clostridium sp.]|jgi:hypothetical protein